jgi:hypothetical protein
MNDLISVCLILIVLALWGIEWKLEKILNKLDRDEKDTSN